MTAKEKLIEIITNANGEELEAIQKALIVYCAETDKAKETLLPPLR